MAKVFRVNDGSMAHRFLQCRARIQVLGGGFGNGKTATSCVKALQLAMDYPGSNGLIARATYPKLNDTIRREFFNWCPDQWIKRKPTKDDNTLYLSNGSVINFRYISQRGVTEEGATSNLLSATYDFIVVDQMEDPEITYKDFTDLIGRLRGSAKYTGNDETMPKRGPQWFIITTNPTANWVYRKLVRPYHRWLKGINDPELICQLDNSFKPVILDGRPVPDIEVIEGSTMENVENVGIEYIKSMRATYKGKMADRYIDGAWGALSGLVYPDFDETHHVIAHEQIMEYMNTLYINGYSPTFIDAFDYGQAVPACYLLAFVDDDRNVFITDGFYKAERKIFEMAQDITSIRTSLGVPWSSDLSRHSVTTYADPQCFKRGPASNSRSIGKSVAALFEEEGILMQRANNAIHPGIAKVSQFLAKDFRHEHPITGDKGSARLFVSDKLTWYADEILGYYWAASTNDERTDKPRDVRDHAMDATRYLLTGREAPARYVGKPDAPPPFMRWHEAEAQEAKRKARRL